jgi:hypothetical protein
VSAGGGIAADPYVLGAIREYWLKCAALNDRDPSRAVDPREFILDWLRASHPELSAVVATLPYWPVGQDEKGRWM